MASLCTSCNTNIANQGGIVRFKCPSCAKEEIVRCSHCRSIGVKYKCKCGFEGP